MTLHAASRPGVRSDPIARPRRRGARVRRYLPAALAMTLAGLVAPPSASALIQIDEGIAGARLGNTRSEVRTALGTPTSVRRGTNDFGPWLEYRYSGGIRVTFQGRRRVTGVSTTGLGDRTARGVGVGSSETAVENRVPGVTCETIVGTRSCHTGDFTPGQEITDFLLEDGRVKRVTVAIVID